MKTGKERTTAMEYLKDVEFLRLMPKVELHAHLNGSLCTASIEELGKALYGSNTTEFLRLSQQFVNCDDMNLEDCFQKFHFIHELTATSTGLALATELVIRDFASDNVVYLEVRTTPKANEHMTKRAYLECVLDTIRRCMRVLSTRVVLLPSIDRGQSVEAAAETVRLALELRETNSDLLTGLDFSGNPKCGHFDDFVPALAAARRGGLKLSLHCAEIDNPIEVAKMLKFGMDRCGHGTYLSAEQIELLVKRQTAIECCLTSNLKCGTVRHYDDHHFKRIFSANGDVTVLCTDDCGVFDTTLTHEFEVAQQTFQLQRNDLLRLNLNAVQHAFVDEHVKHELRMKIQKYFNTFS